MKLHSKYISPLWWRRTTQQLLAVLMVCAFAPQAWAAADERQFKIEAAFLYSFFNYITWPGYESPQALVSPLICVYGDDPIITYLDYISSKMKEERRLKVRSISDEDAASGCHILFIRHRISYRMLNTLAGDTLVVFKPDDPLDRGGMIELSEDGQRIAIKIDQPQLEKNNFQVSSRLLELAKK